MNITRLLNSLSAARMEYESLDNSVLNRFVVPFKIDELDLRNQKLSTALVGSRGSGKSTYIKYFSHSTRLHQDLDHIDKSELDCLIMYWKPDIAYCQGLNEQWLGEETAFKFFKLHSSIELIDEFAKMVANICHHFPDHTSKIKHKDSYTSKAIFKVTNGEVKKLEDLESWADDQRFDISTRLNPINTEGMLSLDPKATIQYVVNSLVRDCNLLERTHFKIYVDEFELLTKNQQRLINSYRKESRAIIGWNVAYKLYAKPTFETLSDQPLQEPDDYRTAVLDDLIKNDFALYASEIFLLSMKTAGFEFKDLDIDPILMGDRSKIEFRCEPNYRDRLLNATKRLFPTKKVSDFSEDLSSTAWLRKKIDSILKEIDRTDISTDEILLNPSMAVVIAGTYHQKSFNLDHFIAGKLKEKITTFELSSLLTFRNQNSQLNIPIYSGFNRFITMTTPNVRHFKELCFASLKQHDEAIRAKEIACFEEIPPVPIEYMDAATITTSKLLVSEVVSYPPYGNKLSALVNRIGELFKISQKSHYQTEPERVIFSIKYDYANSDEELESILSAAECWRVLVSDDSKRLKSENQLTTKEYTLNPIYSPRYCISYRKKRGIIFELDEFKILLNGSYDDFEAIKAKYRKIWKYDIEETEKTQIKHQDRLL